MKHLIFLLIAIFALPVMVFSQTDIPAPPDNWMDVIVNLQTWFASFGGIVVVTAFIAAMFNGIVNVKKGFVKQLVAWVVAILILIVADLVNFGYVAEYPLSLAVVHGFAAGLAANGFFDIPFLKTILDRVEVFFKKKPITE